ncbi:MAG: Maleamate amidohydrolase [Alphaproteobacteria bacterium MarineAlpha2_Bin1]|nr:MAG: Maleamate amidohydrolase [Alphaproteobacteria bacterium MarineAlpha2_Bin1]
MVINKMKPWDKLISDKEKKAYRAAGFGRKGGMGIKPVLLIIDVQYRTAGSSAKPFWDSIKEYPTSCGDVAWTAIKNISDILKTFRKNNWPIIYPHVAPKKSYDGGQLALKVPEIMNISEEGYKFVKEVEPTEKDILVPKKHPSAFFGTSLSSYLIDLKADTLILTGCTTSGCIRASVIDAFSLNYKIIVPHDAVYDRSVTSHAINLFDISEKYADVMTSNQLKIKLKKII